MKRKRVREENPFRWLARRDLCGLLGIGVLGWMVAAVGFIVWFFARTEEPDLMGVAVPFYAWLFGHTPGGALMLLYGVFGLVRGWLGRNLVLWAALVYFVPVLAATVVFGLFLFFQPASVRDSDAAMVVSAFSGPLFFSLCFVGLIGGFLWRGRPLKEALQAFMAPPLVGLCLSAVSFVTFTLLSPQWQRRGDFRLAVERIEWREPKGLTVEARLEVERSSKASFHAFYRDGRGEFGRGFSVDTFHFNSSTYKGQAWASRQIDLKGGRSYDVRLDWDDLETSSLDSERQIIFRVSKGPYAMSREYLQEFQINVDPDLETLERLEGKLSPKTIRGMMGYVDRVGKIVIPPQFESAGEFHEGLAVVRIGGKFGYIDETGQIAIPPQFRYATNFAEGLAAAAMERKVGYVDSTGKFVIEPRFDGGYPFSEGLARVRVIGSQGIKEGFIDRSGEMVIPAVWEWAQDFSEGVAAVRVSRKWGFIDRAGSIVIEPKFDGGRLHFKNDRANILLENRWGFVDREGNWTPER